MSNPRFFADEHVAEALVVQCRARGLDIVTVAQAGLRARDDLTEIVPYLIETGRVLITSDHRFRAAMEARARSGEGHPGVIFITPRHRERIGACLDSLTLIGLVSDSEELRDMTLYIPF